jgi:hypothetical protein
LRRVDVLEEHPGRALVALALGSFVLRFAFAVNVRGPVYFRDEYLYSALARAIAHGSLLLRGQHVPGSTTSYLVPLITAPVWRLHDVDTAYLKPSAHWRFRPPASPRTPLHEASV